MAASASRRLLRLVPTSLSLNSRSIMRSASNASSSSSTTPVISSSLMTNSRSWFGSDSGSFSSYFSTSTSRPSWTGEGLNEFKKKYNESLRYESEVSDRVVKRLVKQGVLQSQHAQAVTEAINEVMSNASKNIEIDCELVVKDRFGTGCAIVILFASATGLYLHENGYMKFNWNRDPFF